MSVATDLDPRFNAVRPDLADASLQVLVRASSYVNAQLRQCVRGVLPLFEKPDAKSLRVSEIRYGEFLDVFEQRDDGFAWVQSRTDRYVGYIPSVGALSEGVSELSQRINVLHTYIYAEPDLKSPVIDILTLGSFVQAFPASNGFAQLASGGFVFEKHILPTEKAKEVDYVFTAGRLLGCPYLCGGRTPMGIDCSGLVQLALELAGIDAPRDSDLQVETFGQHLPAHWRDVKWKRGDLVFFKGHVGLMVGGGRLIHANAHAMQVTIEPLVDIVLRGKEIVAMGRIG